MAKTSDTTYNVFCDMDQECRFARIGHEDLTDKNAAKNIGHTHQKNWPVHQISIEEVSRRRWKL